MSRIRAASLAMVVTGLTVIVGPCALARGHYVETPNVEQYDNGKDTPEDSGVEIGTALSCEREYVGAPITCTEQ